MFPTNKVGRNKKNSKLMKIGIYHFCSDSVFKKNRADYRRQKVWMVRKGLFEEVTFNSKPEGR